MKLSDVLFLSGRSIKSNLLETVLEVCATALGVALFASSLSLIQHYVRDIQDASQDLKFRTISVYPAAYSESAAPDTPIRLIHPEVAQNFKFPTTILAQAKADCPDVQYAWAEEKMYYMSGSSGAGESITTSHAVWKVTGDFFESHQVSFKSGAPFSLSDYAVGSQNAVLGVRVARQLEISVLGVALLKPIPCQVSGILMEKPDRFAAAGTLEGIDEAIIMPLSISASTGTLLFTSRGSERMDAAVAQLQIFFDTLYGKQMVSVSSNRNWLQSEKRMSLPIYSAIAFLGGAVLLVIVMNILVLQLGSVGRRTRQIGLASSVGATRRDLMSQYVAEFFLIGLSGGIIGVCAAIGLTSLLQGLMNPQGLDLPGLRLATTPVTLAIAAVCVIAVNFLFALLPAAQAIRTKPSTAMRYE
jgi:putative ABC transport system permease protein